MTIYREYRIRVLTHNMYPSYQHGVHNQYDYPNHASIYKNDWFCAKTPYASIRHR